MLGQPVPELCMPPVTGLDNSFPLLSCQSGQQCPWQWGIDIAEPKPTDETRWEHCRAGVVNLAERLHLPRLWATMACARAGCTPWRDPYRTKGALCPCWYGLIHLGRPWWSGSLPPLESSGLAPSGSSGNVTNSQCQTYLRRWVTDSPTWPDLPAGRGGPVLKVKAPHPPRPFTLRRGGRRNRS